jgi:hypothetical protein
MSFDGNRKSNASALDLYEQYRLPSSWCVLFLC